MKSGLSKPRYDRRDFDYHRTFGTQLPAQLPAQYSVDAGLWNPNQNIENAPTGLDIIPPLPYGCTDYTQTDLCIDEDGKLLSPMLLENVTHANARGGIDIRESLKASVQVFQRTAYFNIKAQPPLDMFDAIRLAMLSTASEKRAVSAGTPFWPEWEVDGILPLPTDFSLSRASWHNWKIAGWKMIGDQPYLVCKMWTGDWKYMSRSLCNAVFGISGSVAYTLSKVAPGVVQTIDFSFVQWVVSFFQQLIDGLNTPVKPRETPLPAPQPPNPTVPATTPPAPASPRYDWSTPEAARHSLRVICDEEGLTVDQKNLMSQVVHCESGYLTTVTHPNLLNGRVVSTDYGICQWNDFYHGKEITPDQAVHDPEKAVRLMCSYVKAGKITAWVCFTSGLYKSYSA